MSRSAILKSVINQQLKLAEIEATEEVGAVLTLRRTANQAITTAGTIIIWQQEVRNFQFTWSGSDITIPSTGWYAIYCAVGTSINLNGILYRINVNATQVAIQSAIGGFALNLSSSSFVRYFQAGNVIQISLFPSANCDIVVTAEGAVSESPFLHIVQLSGGVG